MRVGDTRAATNTLTRHADEAGAGAGAGAGAYLQSTCLFVNIIERDGLRNDGARMVDPRHLHVHACVYVEVCARVCVVQIVQCIIGSWWACSVPALVLPTINRCPGSLQCVPLRNVQCLV